MVLAQTNPAPPTASATTPGRYQITSTAVSANATNATVAEIWMVDTQTGDTWVFRSLVGTWRYVGNPTKDPGLHK